MLSNETQTVKQNVNLPIEEAIHECERELQVRSRCYSRWVKEGKLTEFEAEERYNRLSAACQWLKAQKAELAAKSAKVLDMPASVAA